MDRYSNETVNPTEQSQAVYASEKDPTEVKKKDVWRGFARVDLPAVESKVCVPGEKARRRAETQYGPEEVSD